MNKPGELDISYGLQGYALIPHPFEQNQSPLIYSSTLDPDNGVICSIGYNNGTEDFYAFTRLTPDGQWDTDFAYKQIPAMSAGNVFEQYSFHSMRRHDNPTQATYITQAAAAVYLESVDYLFTAAIGHYDSSFKAQPGFADNGISVPFPEAKKPSKPGKKKAPLNKGDLPAQPGAQSALVNGAIRSIFLSDLYYDSTGLKLWAALLDPQTGRPIRGLGADGQSERLELEAISGDTLHPWSCHYLDDGSFVVAGNAGIRQAVAKYTANALLDKNFLRTGYRLLAERRSVAMHANQKFIHTVIGTPRTDQTVELIISRLLHDGTLDSDFGSFGMMAITIPNDGAFKSATCECVLTDNDGNLYVAGNIGHFNSDMSLQGFVYRVTADGKLDEAFGDDGRFLLPERFTLREAYIQDQQLRIRIDGPEDKNYGMKLHI